MDLKEWLVFVFNQFKKYVIVILVFFSLALVYLFSYIFGWLFNCPIGSANILFSWSYHCSSNVVANVFIYFFSTLFYFVILFYIISMVLKILEKFKSKKSI